ACRARIIGICWQDRPFRPRVAPSSAVGCILKTKISRKNAVVVRLISAIVPDHAGYRLGCTPDDATRFINVGAILATAGQQINVRAGTAIVTPRRCGAGSVRKGRRKRVPRVAGAGKGEIGCERKSGQPPEVAGAGLNSKGPAGSVGSG